MKKYPRPFKYNFRYNIQDHVPHFHQPLEDGALSSMCMKLCLVGRLPSSLPSTASFGDRELHFKGHPPHHTSFRVLVCAIIISTNYRNSLIGVS